MRISGPTNELSIIIFEENDDLLISNLAKRYLYEKLSEYFRTEIDNNKILLYHGGFRNLSDKQRQILIDCEDYIGHLMKIFGR